MSVGCSSRSVTRVCAGGWSCRHLWLACSNIPDPPEEKQVFQRKAHCLHKQFKHRVLGALPRPESPGVRQGPALQASLSKNGSVRPAHFLPRDLCALESLRLTGLVDKAGSIDFTSGYCVTHDKLLDHAESGITISNSKAVFPPREVKSTS